MEISWQAAFDKHRHLRHPFGSRHRPHANILSAVLPPLVWSLGRKCCVRCAYHLAYISIPTVYGDEEEPFQRVSKLMDEKPAEPFAFVVHHYCTSGNRSLLHLLHMQLSYTVCQCPHHSYRYSLAHPNGDIKTTKKTFHRTGASVHTKSTLKRHRSTSLFEGRLLDRNLHIGIFEVPEDSLWAGKQLQDLQLRNRFGIHVSSIQRGIQRLNIPNGETVIFPGDKIQAIGDDEQLADFSQALRKEMVAEDYDIEQRETKLRQLVLSGKSDFIGKTLQDSGIRDKYNCMVVGVEEGQQSLTMINPSRRFEKGDIIWVVGEESALNTIVQHC